MYNSEKTTDLYRNLRGFGLNQYDWQLVEQAEDNLTIQNKEDGSIKFKGEAEKTESGWNWKWITLDEI